MHVKHNNINSKAYSKQLLTEFFDSIRNEMRLYFKFKSYSLTEALLCCCCCCCVETISSVAMFSVAANFEITSQMVSNAILIRDTYRYIDTKFKRNSAWNLTHTSYSINPNTSPSYTAPHICNANTINYFKLLKKLSFIKRIEYCLFDIVYLISVSHLCRVRVC